MTSALMTSSSIFSRYLTELDQLLVECFEIAELLRFLDRVLGATVVAELPSSGESPRAHTHDVIRTLRRRGLIDSRLFAALVQERPTRAKDFSRVAAGLKVSVLELTERDTVVWRGNHDEHKDRREWVEALEQRLIARERLDAGDPMRAEIERGIDSMARRIRSAPMLGTGSVIAGTRLEKLVGAGNFGAVWRARQVSTNNLVATKIFHSDRLTDGIMMWRFRRSIRALQALGRYRHAPASIPEILEVAPDMLAFAMPYFPNGTLEQIDRRGWSLATKLAVFQDVCRAVAFSHQMGVIHRDIKPANVLLNAASRPILIDFDIADISFVTNLSVASGGLGTPIFAAPEQLEDAELADERSDIYSLGRLLHYMLLDRSPGHQIERDPTLANLRGMPPALVSVVRKACQWDPRRRHDSVDQLVGEIDEHHRGFAALRAHYNNTSRWIRGHIALLTTCMTLVGTAAAIAGTSSTIASIQTQLAASRAETLAVAEQRLGEHEATRSELDATVRRFDALQARVRGLLSELYDLSSSTKYAEPNGQEDLRQIISTANTLVGDLEALRISLADDLVVLGQQQARLRGLLRADGSDTNSGSREATSVVADDGPMGRAAVSVSVPEHHVKSNNQATHTNVLPEQLQTSARQRRRKERLPLHGDSEHLAAIKLEVKPRILQCVNEARDADKTARLDVWFNVAPSGRIFIRRISREFRRETKECIMAVLNSAKFQKTLKGDRVHYVII